MNAVDDLAAQLSAFLDVGGPVVGVLLAMSVFAMAVALLKIYQFWSVRIGDRRFIEPAYAHHKNGDAANALTILAHARNPIARVMEAAIRGGTLPKISEETVREEVIRIANLHLVRLRGFLRSLEVVGTLSPLLGLFGTVLGMIDAFQQLEGAGNQVNPAILSRGIWEALLTTAAGLTVAIPTVAVATWLERRVDRLAADMEDAATRIFTVGLSHPSESHAEDAIEQPQPAFSD